MAMFSAMRGSWWRRTGTNPSHSMILCAMRFPEHCCRLSRLLYWKTWVKQPDAALEARTACGLVGCSRHAGGTVADLVYITIVLWKYYYPVTGVSTPDLVTAYCLEARFSSMLRDLTSNILVVSETRLITNNPGRFDFSYGLRIHISSGWTN